MPLSTVMKSGSLALLASAVCAANTALAQQAVEEIVIWGSESDQRRNVMSPASVLDPEDFRAINMSITEDVVKFEPSVVIRRRFIGDSNGVLGMRGSNMFQTSRSMVFASSRRHVHCQCPACDQDQSAST